MIDGRYRLKLRCAKACCCLLYGAEHRRGYRIVLRRADKSQFARMRFDNWAAYLEAVEFWLSLGTAEETARCA